MKTQCEGQLQKYKNELEEAKKKNEQLKGVQKLNQELNGEVIRLNREIETLNSKLKSPHVRPRNSLASKSGLTKSNSPGVIKSNSPGNMGPRKT
jgi:predicted RNase H-like nuclease (RuvC/YqgF family)